MKNIFALLLMGFVVNGGSAVAGDLFELYETRGCDDAMSASSARWAADQIRFGLRNIDGAISVEAKGCKTSSSDLLGGATAGGVDVTGKCSAVIKFSDYAAALKYSKYAALFRGGRIEFQYPGTKSYALWILTCVEY